MSPKAESYLNRSEHYWADAQVLLNKADWTQASEKLWGAIAELVKAIAEEKGWKHDGHASLFGVVSRLAKEMSRPEFQKAFGLASALHTNFYEGWLTAEQVQSFAEDAQRLRQDLKALIK